MKLGQKAKLPLRERLSQYSKFDLHLSSCDFVDRILVAKEKPIHEITRIHTNNKKAVIRLTTEATR
jgi:hypothetical protein